MASEWLDDAFGPDGVRVTLCVEPAVERFIRERDAWTTPKYGLFPNPFRNAVRQLLPEILQTKILKGRWVVAIEADSGERRRISRPTRDEAMEAARVAWTLVKEQGVPAIASLE